LLVSSEPITADQVKQELCISTGNVSMNLRALIDWGLVFKILKPGERKELYYAEKDMWKVFRQIILNRKRRELEPMLQLLDELVAVEGKCPQSEAFCDVVRDIRKISHRANSALDLLAKTDSNPLLGTLFGLAK
jgi:DNA-binding transcriptional regulator GbsR (MarR family)